MAPAKTGDSLQTKLRVFETTLNSMSKQLDTIEQDLKANFASAIEFRQLRIEFADLRKDTVTQDQYWPIKTAVYGGVGLILIAAVTAILALIFRGHA